MLVISCTLARIFVLLMMSVYPAAGEKPSSQQPPPTVTVTADRMAGASSSQRWKIPCSNQYQETTPHPGCSPVQGGPCDRRVVDDFLSTTEVEQLLRMAQTGMALAPTTSIVGSTKVNVNTGWVMAPETGSTHPIYTTGHHFYSHAEYVLYHTVRERLKTLVEHTFAVTPGALHFTAPTFFTRAVGGHPHWQPTILQDEYWHLHSDKNNTDHYDYSGLIYLSTYGLHFHGGGHLEFYNASSTSVECSTVGTQSVHQASPCVVSGPPDLIVEPRQGRAVVFGSGRENPHRVTRVQTGTRYVLAFWFSCDPQRQFPQLLDGKAHQTV